MTEGLCRELVSHNLASLYGLLKLNVMFWSPCCYLWDYLLRLCIISEVVVEGTNTRLAWPWLCLAKSWKAPSSETAASLGSLIQSCAMVTTKNILLASSVNILSHKLWPFNTFCYYQEGFISAVFITTFQVVVAAVRLLLSWFSACPDTQRSCPSSKTSYFLLSVVRFLLALT